MARQRSTFLTGFSQIQARRLARNAAPAPVIGERLHDTPSSWAILTAEIGRELAVPAGPPRRLFNLERERRLDASQGACRVVSGEVRADRRSGESTQPLEQRSVMARYCKEL